MGVCCSKREVVKVQETIGDVSNDRALLLAENIGEAGKINNSSGLHGTLNNNQLPEIKEPEGAQTQETETVDSYNKENQSAARSTLIFPSYSAYRNQDRFGVNKKTLLADSTPTALVSPVQTNPSSPYLSAKAVDFVTQRSSPMPSRYTPLLSNNRDYRSRPGAFERQNVLPRKGSLDSGGFDSDLDSDNDNLTLQQEAERIVSTQSLDISTDDNNSKIELPRISIDQSENLNSKKTTDAGVGTGGLDNKTTSTQSVDSGSIKSKTTASVGTDPQVSQSRTKSSEVKTSEAALSTKNNKSNKKTSGTQIVVKMVDASVGTDSDKFYRSKKSRKINVDLKKEQTKTCSTGAGPDTGSDESNKKQTHDMMVGTEPLTTETRSTKANAETETESNLFYVKLVDACVGTDSDDFYRSKKSRKIQVDKKKKKRAMLQTTGMGTNTDSSPKPLRKPRIVTEDSETPSMKRRSAKSSPVPPSEKKVSKEEQERHPIIETLENAFMRFAKYGDINGDGKEMNNKNWAKLCRDCEFVDNRHVLVGEVDVIFSRHKQKGYRLINFEMFINCLNEIADKTYSSKMKDEWARRELIYQRVIGKAPELVGITGISKTGNVDRMTDHLLYPVSHKMRFDEEGKGLGIDDKFEIHDTQMGYVQGYKERDTYDLKMMGITRERSGTNMTSSRLASPRSPRRPLSSSSVRS